MTVASVLKYVRLDEGLAEPSRANPADAGIDLRARIDAEVSFDGGPVTIPTGIAVAIPHGFVGLVCSRSGLASQKGIAVLNAPGVVDHGFTGELEVVLFSVNPRAHVVSRGERIAQLVVVATPSLDMREVRSLQVTQRGSSGFGSSGS
jgi:dUTP pyrophosphatase